MPTKLSLNKGAITKYSEGLLSKIIATALDKFGRETLVARITVIILLILTGRILREFIEMQEKMSKAIRSTKIKFKRSMDLNKLSFVIPTFNEEKCIEYLLKTLTYNFPAAEVIVVDAMSTDRTISIAEKYGAKILRTKLDIGASTNLGFLVANGKIVIRMEKLLFA